MHMTVKVLGALLILIGTGGVGYALNANDRRHEQAMVELQRCLQWMIWELRYKMPPLAELCRDAAKYCKGSVGQVLRNFSDELQQQLQPDPSICMQAAISMTKMLPVQATVRLKELGVTLGQFDLQSQIASLEASEALCRHDLEQMRTGREVRKRNYQTLSLCAGAALVILLF
jgi:stage III sporulation protein AB